MVIALEVINNKFMLSRSQLIVIGGVVFLLTIFMKFNVTFGIWPDFYRSIRIIVGQVFQLMAGFITIYGFTRIKLISKNARTKRIQKLWIFAGIIIVIISVTTISVELTRFIYAYQDIALSSDMSSTLALLDQIISMLILLLSLITMVFALFYPETLLLSMYQIAKAAKLYELMDSTPSNQQGSDSSLFYTEEIILEYLNSIPKDLIEKI